MARTQFSLTADIVVYDRIYGKVLVVKRKNPPFQDGWALPGGFVDEGETLVRAAQRELKEETGLDVAIENLIPVGIYDDPDRDPRGRVISAAYVTLWNGNPVQAGDDAAELDWASTARELAFDHSKIVYAAMYELRRLCL